MKVEPSFECFAAAYAAGKPSVLYTRLVADLETPVSAMLKLAAGRPYSCLLESVEGGTTLGRYSVIALTPDRRVVMVAVREYLDRVFGKERIMDPDVLEPTRPKFDPSLYTPEQLEEIERVLRMVQATQGEDDGK